MDKMMGCQASFYTQEPNLFRPCSDTSILKSQESNEMRTLSFSPSVLYVIFSFSFSLAENASAKECECVLGRGGWGRHIHP